jgi:hypothetical protein
MIDTLNVVFMKVFAPINITCIVFARSVHCSVLLAEELYLELIMIYNQPWSMVADQIG